MSSALINSGGTMDGFDGVGLRPDEDISYQKALIKAEPIEDRINIIHKTLSNKRVFYINTIGEYVDGVFKDIKGWARLHRDWSENVSHLHCKEWHTFSTKTWTLVINQMSIALCLPTDQVLAIIRSHRMAKSMSQIRMSCVGCKFWTQHVEGMGKCSNNHSDANFTSPNDVEWPWTFSDSYCTHWAEKPVDKSQKSEYSWPLSLFFKPKEG